MGDFSAGIKALKSGVDQLGGGAGSLADGANQLNDSAKQISAGIAQLDQTLNAPLSTEERAAIEQSAQSEVDTLMNNGQKAQIIALAKQQLRTANGGQFVNSLKTSIRYQVASNVESSIAAAESSFCYDRSATVAHVYDNTPALRAGVQAALGLPSEVPTYAALENIVVESQLNQMAETIADSVIDGTKQGAAKAAVEATQQTKATVAAAIEATQANGYSLVTGSQALSNGTQQLANQIPTLTSGVTALVNGTNQIADGTNQLSDGIGKLEKGSNTLSEGMIKFDEEGIQKLADTYNGDVKDLVERIVAVMQAGSDYQAFSQVADGTTGSVKFITRTEGVNVKED